MKIRSLLIGLVWSSTAIAQSQPSFYPEILSIPKPTPAAASFRETIDNFTGSLTVSQSDLLLPGNGGFDISVQRTYKPKRYVELMQPYGFNWNMHLGRLIVSSFACDASIPIAATLELPDGTSYAIHRASAILPGTATTLAVSDNFWRFKCQSASSTPITATAPDGTTYLFDRSDAGIANATTFYPSKITDRNNNIATLTYLQAPSGKLLLQQVSASDGRLISFAYDAQFFIKSMTASDRVWQYALLPLVDGSGQTLGAKNLTAVTPPLGAAWTYSYFPSVAGTSLSVAEASSTGMKKIVNPFGGWSEYTYKYAAPYLSCAGVCGSAYASVIDTMKNSDGAQWTYTLQFGNVVGDLNTTTIVGPDYTAEHKFNGINTFVYFDDLWKIGLPISSKLTSAQGVKTETPTWARLLISNDGFSVGTANNYSPKNYRPILQQKQTTRDGQVFATTYSLPDGFGQPQGITDVGTASRVTNIVYDNDLTKWFIGRAASTTVVGAGTVSRTFDANGNVDSITRYGEKVKFSYLSDGAISQRTSPRDLAFTSPKTTTYANYSRGVPKLETRPEQIVIARDVDYFGNVTSSSDGISTWKYGFDKLNRLLSVDSPIGDDTLLAWTDNSYSLTRGSYTQGATFDGFGRQLTLTSAGVTTTTSYDQQGRKKFESFPGSTLGRNYTYDMFGRPKQITSSAGNVNYGYSADAITIVNEKLQSTKYSYELYRDDEAGYLKEILTPENSTQMNRNAVGSLNWVIQGGVRRDFTYYTNNYLKSVTDPETGTTTFGRDQSGNMTSREVGGVTIAYDYDALDRLSKVRYPSADGNVDYVYNARSQVTKRTSLNSWPKSPSQTSIAREYEYDANGNLQLDRLTVDDQVFTTLFAHDTRDNPSKITYPLNNREVSFSPDPRGLPTTVTPYISLVSHAPSRNLSEIRFQNGVIMTFGENSRQLPDSIGPATSPVLQMAYVYDAVGNPISITNNSTGSGLSLCYDGISRLTSTAGCGTPNFSYDARDNLTRNGATTYTYDTSNRLATTVGGVPRTFTTDARGRITGYSGKTFDFDHASQLKCVNCGLAGEIRYAYDGTGQRVMQEKAGKRTYFVQASNGDLLLEYTPVGKVWKEHAYLHGKRIATQEGTNLIPVTLGVAAFAQQFVYGASTDLKATGLGAAIGTVQFFDGEVSLGTAPIVLGEAIKTVAGMTVGTHNIKASFVGSPDYAAADSAVLVVTVTKANQTIFFTAPGPITPGAPPFALTATSSANLAVQFASSTPTICTTSGVNSATLTFTGTSGQCTVTASQPGNTNVNPAPNVSQSFQVARVNPVLSLTSSNSSELIGQPVTLTTTFSGASSATGTLTLKDGVTVLNTTTVQAGTVTYSYSTNVLALGSHSLQASYTGDANNAPSDSNVVTQMISKRISVATCSASAATILNTANLTFTVGITGNAPTGTVTIAENGGTLATATLVNGSASAVLRLAAPGLHNITATYSGDGNHLPSTCTAVPVQVNFDPALLTILFSDDD